MCAVLFLVQAFIDCVHNVMFGGPLPGEDKTNKLKEVLGWVNDWVKVLLE